MPLLNFTPQQFGLLGDSLTGIGMGLLNQQPNASGQYSALGGVGQGLQYAQGLQQQRRATASDELRDKLAQQQLALQQQAAQQQAAQFKQQQDQHATQQAAAQAMFGGVPSAPVNAGGARMTGAGPGASVPPSMSAPSAAVAGMDPAQLQIMQAMVQGGDAEGAMGLAAQQAFQKPAGPQSSLAKLASDLKSGLISQPEYDAAVKKETYIAPQAPKGPDLVTLVGPGGETQTLDANTASGNATLHSLLGQGYVQRSGADPNSKPFTEDQSKTSQLLTELLPDAETGHPGDYQIAMQNFDALKVLKDQVAGKTPEVVQSFFTSPEYQRGKNAVAHIIANNLYSKSGAQITEEEANRLATILMPQPGESDASIADKQARISGLLNGMKARAGRAGASLAIPKIQATQSAPMPAVVPSAPAPVQQAPAAANPPSGPGW